MKEFPPLASDAEKAARLEKIVRDELTERHGLVRGALDIATRKPFTREDFGPGVDRLRHKPALGAENFGEYFAYENTGMSTGGWLTVQTLKYRATRDEKVLAGARRTFEALRELYEKSQVVAPGFFSKFHEAKISLEISTDQCLYACHGLDQFSELASAAERGEIAKIIGGIAGFWMARGYKHPYRDRDFDWPWPINRFPPLLWLAWKHTGEPRFFEEFQRICREELIREIPPFFSTTRKRWRDEAGADAHWPFGLEMAASGQLTLEPMLAHDAPERELWLAHLKELIEASLPDLAEDCLQRGQFSWDAQSGIAQEVEVPRYSGGKPNPIWEAKYYISAARSGHSPTMYARALFSAHHYFPERGWNAIAWRILRTVEVEQMLLKVDHQNHLPANQKWLTRCLSGDAVVNWLWAYWLAATRGIS